MYFVSRFECRIKTARIGTSSRCNFRLSVSTDYRSFYCLFILFKVGLILYLGKVLQLKG